MTDGTEQPQYDGAPFTSDQFDRAVVANQPNDHQSAPYQSASYQSAPYQSAPYQSAPYQSALQPGPQRSEPYQSALQPRPYQSALYQAAPQQQATAAYGYPVEPQPFGPPSGTMPYVPYPYQGQSQYGYRQPNSSNGMAVASLILSICGFMFFGLPALVGLGVGIAGYRESKRTGVGRGKSIAGIVIGIVWIILYLAVAAFLIAYLPDQA